MPAFAVIDDGLPTVMEDEVTVGDAGLFPALEV